MASTSVTLRPRTKPNATDRHDRWWLLPLTVVIVLGAFIVYATWAAFINADYYVGQQGLLSPFYSPCLTTTCQYVHIPIFGPWWPKVLTPAILVLWAPLGLRVTCYYYRKAYYRSFFWSPPACAVPDAPKGYTGERRFPLILQNVHRYFFWLSLVVLFFLWWDVVQAFIPGIGVGSFVLLVATSLLTLYSLSCHSCRYFCGGYLDKFHGRKLRYWLWRVTSSLNARHTQFAWFSLFAVALADLYVRVLAHLIASGAISAATLWTRY